MAAGVSAPTAGPGGPGADRHMTPGAVVFWASMACMAHVAVMYPLDTCRRCMQVNSGCGGVWRVLRDLYATQGVPLVGHIVFLGHSATKLTE